jgi:hypothetical protein
MVIGALLNWIMRPRLGGGQYAHAGAVAARLVLILGLSLGIWAAPSADAAEESAEQLRYTGKVSVLDKPVTVIAATGDCQVYDYTGRRMRDPVRPSVRTRTGGELTWIRLSVRRCGRRRKHPGGAWLRSSLRESWSPLRSARAASC